MKKYLSILCAAVLFAGLGLCLTNNANAGKPAGPCDGYSDQSSCDADCLCTWNSRKSTCKAANPDTCGGGTEDTAALCSDQIDNDNDGLTDCADPDCAAFCGGGTCADYPDKATCQADATCEWVGKGKNAHCQDIPGTTTRDVIVMATNDLGMHCACPTSQYFLLLPPFNTLRAQVIERDINNLQGGTPFVLSDPNDIRVEYNIVENTDASLADDPYYQAWLAAAPTLFPGYDPSPGGVMTGLAGKGLYGEMDAQPEGWYEAVGIPAFPDVSSNSTTQEKIMTDPLGGPNRNPYLTGNVKVYEQSSGTLLAETNTTVPVAFGGCCTCHLPMGGGDPLTSFQDMGARHEADSGVNFADPAQLDPDNDGLPGPIRCSQCHVDAAMGESTAPGYPGLPTSQYTFSNVVHRWHVENPNVLAVNPDLATDCYACHPGNGVNCYRGHHTGKGQWCTDCHGDLNQRVAEHQMDDPWSPNTLPTCTKCHSNTGENNVLSAFGGPFLKSMSHKNDKILCSTCHGEPHGLNPSTLAKDNEQNLRLQNDDRAIGVCNTCHVGRSDTYGVPMH